VISLNGQKILVRNALHVPGLVVLLYSLRAHCTQRGCGFIGTFNVGILVYFPMFVLLVDTSKDCHLTFDSLGRSAPIDSLDYVQPCCSPTLYPAELSSTTAAKTSPVPNIVEDDCSMSPNTILAPSSPVPSLPPSSVLSSSDSSADNLSGISARLQSLADAILSLQAQQRPPVPLGEQPPPQSDNDASPSLPVLASTMSREDIISILHRDGSSLPAIRPCDTANNSDTKTHWTAEEIHQAMGC
jgi:hypothetical protein